MNFEKLEFWKILAASIFAQGCAQGIQEEPIASTTQNCTFASELKCQQRTWPATVQELEVIYFGENKNSLITAYDFLLPEQQVTLSYGNKDKNTTFKTRAGEMYSLEEGTLYIGNIHFQQGNRYVSIFLAEKEVKTQTVNILAGVDDKKLEEIAFNSNCTERKYFFNASGGSGASISSKDQERYLLPTTPFAELENLLLMEYDYGWDGCLVQKLENTEEYLHAIVHFFEDAVECK